MWKLLDFSDVQQRFSSPGPSPQCEVSGAVTPRVCGTQSCVQHSPQKKMSTEITTNEDWPHVNKGDI